MTRGTGAFAAAAISQRMLGLLLLPLFARVLSPAEYGEIAVIITIVAGLGAVTAFGLETAVVRSYVQTFDQHRRQVLVNSLGGFALVVPMAVGTVLAVTAATLPAIWDIEPVALGLAILGGAATVSLTLVPLAILRAQERFGDYLRVTFLQLAVSTVLTVLFVVGLRWSVLGWGVAAALSGLSALVGGLVILGHRWSFEFDWNPVRRALSFGLPLVPHALAHWGLALSDRTVLGAYVPPSEVGTYYIAYQACLPITVLAVALAQASQPTLAQAAISRDALKQAARQATGHVVVTVLSAAAVALAAPPLIRLVLPDSYHAAGPLVPWLALGTCLFGLYFIPMNALTVMAGRTQWIWTVTVSAAVLNLGLNLMLVPAIGTLAAAINTAIGYGALLLGVSVMVARGGRRLRYEGVRIAIAVAVVLLISSIGLTTAPREPLAALGISMLLLLLAAVLLALLLFFREMKSTVSAIASWRSGTAS